MTGQLLQIQIQILSVPDCPLVAKVQDLVENCLQQAHIEAPVDVIVGNYNSPTLLVNGFDVTGYKAPIGQISCRLDPPNEEEILAALRIVPLFDGYEASEKAIFSRLFQLLFTAGKPVDLSYLCESGNLQSQIAAQYAQRIQESGVLRMNSDRHVIASAGLSVSPTKHELIIEGRRFWAWCALDILGIFGAYNASGSAHSHEPETNSPIHIEFVKGRPLQTDTTVICLTDTSHVSSLCHDWCPSINFFTSRSLGEEWLRKNSIKGFVISIHNATNAARQAWVNLIQ